MGVKSLLQDKTPAIRYLDDMRNVIADKEWLKTAPNLEMYYMYRKVKVENELNYNVTIIPARMLGNEYNKTKGHIHIGNFGEVYQVVEGEAIFLMQKTEQEKVLDVYAVKAKAGESVIIKPEYGHVTINPSEKNDLKTEDWSSVNCKSDYSLFDKLNGACYHYTKAGWIQNNNYKNVPPLRFEQPLKSLPKNLDFLKG